MDSESANPQLQPIREVLDPDTFIPLLVRFGIAESEAAPIAYGLDPMLEKTPRKFAWYEGSIERALDLMRTPAEHQLSADIVATTAALILALRKEKLQVLAIQDSAGGYLIQAEVPPSFWANSEPGTLLFRIMRQQLGGVLVTAEPAFRGASYGRGKRFIRRIFQAIDAYLQRLA